MFETLSDRLTQVFSSLRGRGRLSQADIDATCREIRIALLEADVALPVVRDFIAKVRERASGAEVSEALNPAQQVIKIVNEELIEILGGEARRLRFAKVPPTVIMLAGLQGSGKTTLAGKLALWLKSQGNTPLLVAADLQRPNAVQQLQVLGQRAGVPVFAPFPGSGVGDPVQAADMGIAEAQHKLHNIVIIDTAGRLGIDAEMMQQAADIRDAVDPDEILFVVDAMIGQDAVQTAQAFLDGVGYDGVVLTKLDGDARGGAALSIAQLTGRPVMFASTGEKLEDFDVFHPDRMASRILDLGDMLTLIEQAERTFDQDQAADHGGQAGLRRGLHARGLRRAAGDGPQARPDRQPARHAAGRGAEPRGAQPGQRQGPGPGRGDRQLDDARGAPQPEDPQRLAPGPDRGRIRRHGRRGQPADRPVPRGPEDDAPDDGQHAWHGRNAPAEKARGKAKKKGKGGGRPAGADRGRQAAGRPVSAGQGGDPRLAAGRADGAGAGGAGLAVLARAACPAALPGLARCLDWAGQPAQAPGQPGGFGSGQPSLPARLPRQARQEGPLEAGRVITLWRDASGRM